MKIVNCYFTENSAFAEIVNGDNDKKYDVQFFNTDTNELVYNAKISNGGWARSSLKTTNIKIYDGNTLIYDEYDALHSRKSKLEKLENKSKFHESNLHKWDGWYEDLSETFYYGDTVTYKLAADFLFDCDTVEDWGCGGGGFMLHRPDAIGVDGSDTKFATKKFIDLTTYISDCDGIHIRHVFEHNYQWKEILINALSSAKKKLVITFFIPPGENNEEIVSPTQPRPYSPNGFGVPDLKISRSELYTIISNTNSIIRSDIFETDTEYGHEEILYIIKSPQLSIPDKKELINIAKKTIEQKLYDNSVYEPQTNSEILNSNIGAFVTLIMNDDVRGCAGIFSNIQKLCIIVRDMALQSAFHDDKFEPITKEEYDIINIEISVLSSTLKKIHNINEIDIRRHGIYMFKDVLGVLLPQNIIQNNWSLEESLRHCSHDKMGLDWDDWKTSRLLTFEVDAFNDKELSLIDLLVDMKEALFYNKYDKFVECLSCTDKCKIKSDKKS